MALFGYAKPRINLNRFTLKSPVLNLGDGLDFLLEIQSSAKKDQSLLIDCVFHFRKSNQKLSPKVFKWTKVKIAPGESLLLNRVHQIKSVTTRKYYSGEQALSLRINGSDFGWLPFTLNC